MFRMVVAFCVAALAPVLNSWLLTALDDKGDWAALLIFPMAWLAIILAIPYDVICAGVGGACQGHWLWVMVRTSCFWGAILAFAAGHRIRHRGKPVTRRPPDENAR